MNPKFALAAAVASSSAVACSMGDYTSHIIAIERFAAAMLVLSIALAVVGSVSAMRIGVKWAAVFMTALLALHPAWWISAAGGCGYQRASASLFGTLIIAFVCLRIVSHRKTNPWLPVAVVLVILPLFSWAIPQHQIWESGFSYFMIRSPALLACWLSMTTSVLGDRLESALRRLSSLNLSQRRTLKVSLSLGIPVALFAFVAILGVALCTYQNRGDGIQEIAFGWFGEDFELVKR